MSVSIDLDAAGICYGQIPGKGNRTHQGGTAGSGTVVVEAGTVVTVVVGAGTVVVEAGTVVTVVVEAGTVVVGSGTVVVGAGSVVDVVAGDVVGGLVGDVGVGSATVEVGSADDGTGGKAARVGVAVVVTPGESGLGLASDAVGIVDGAVGALAVVVIGSALGTVVADVDVDGASAIPGSVSVGKEVDGACDPIICDRTSAPLPPLDRRIGSKRAATQPKAASNPLNLRTACATRLSRIPSTTPQS